MNQFLQKYNVEEDPTDQAPPPLSSSLSLFSRLQLELELDELELELELDELEGSSLLGWIIETLALILLKIYASRGWWGLFI